MNLPEASPKQPDQSKEIVPEVEKALRDKSLPPEFTTLSPDVRREVVSSVSSVAIKVSHESWEGAFPPPSVLREFEDALPGSADRIFKMAENDLTHRHDIESCMSSYMTRGQWFGFLLAAIALSGSVYLISIGERVVGGVLGSTIILPLVAMFVTGQISMIKGAPEEKPKPAPGQPKLNGKAKPNGKLPRGGRR